MNKAELNNLVGEAEELGRNEGHDAGGDFWNVRWGEDEIRRLYNGIQAGDPQIMDELPSAPLSGEWAGDRTPQTLLIDLGVEDEEELTPEEIVEVCDSYENAWNLESQQAIEETCLYYLTREVDVTFSMEVNLADPDKFQELVNKAEGIFIEGEPVVQFWGVEWERQ